MRSTSLFPKPYLRALCAFFLVILTAACVGSDKPKKVVRGQILEKPYVPYINPDLLVPAKLIRDDLIYKKDRAAIRRVSETEYRNSWNACDDDIKRVTTPKKPPTPEGD